MHGPARDSSRATSYHRDRANYLLLDRAPWSDLAALFDLTIFLDVTEDKLERRLIARWRGHGYDLPAALDKALDNDIPNARLVAAASRPAHITLTQETALT